MKWRPTNEVVGVGATVAALGTQLDGTAWFVTSDEVIQDHQIPDLARLIAAAPDLLEAAKALVVEWEAERFEWVENRDLGGLIRNGQPPTGGDWFDRLRAAIAKAEGEPAAVEG